MVLRLCSQSTNSWCKWVVSYSHSLLTSQFGVTQTPPFLQFGLLVVQQVFCYKSVIELLSVRPGFIEKFESWRSRKVTDGVLADLYDGNVWKQFLNPNSVPFVSFCIYTEHWLVHTHQSLDWRYISRYSERSERYNSENVGVIPGPHEPSKTMNDYLKPLISELLELWQGVVMKYTSGANVMVRAALLCTACDIPASRKVSCFIGQNALHGCSKCFKAFPTAKFGEKPNYTAFDWTLWEPRSMQSHRQHEREYGCILLELPYYDVSVIDPM